MNIAEITAAERARKLDALLTHPLNTIEPDNCCAKPLSAHLRQNPATLGPWDCPKCGCQWMPTLIEGVRHWAAQVVIEVFR